MNIEKARETTRLAVAKSNFMKQCNEYKVFCMSRGLWPNDAANLKLFFQER